MRAASREQIQRLLSTRRENRQNFRGFAAARGCSFAATSDAKIAQSESSAARICGEAVTQPKMPPCALIIASPAAWNSGKYEAQQSDSTMQRKPRSFASRTVVLTQTS